MKNLGSIDNSKSVLTKEYGDNMYAPKSEIATLSEKLRVANLLANESNFKSEANFRAFNYGFEYLCIELLHHTDDIDSTSYDGATIIADYYDNTNHEINKTSSDTLSIQSTKFSLETSPSSVLVLVDYEGTGSVNLAFSKDNGSTWTQVNNDTLTSLPVSESTDIRYKVELIGNVILKNIAWGCR